jgi:GTP-binding protein Era
MSSAMKNKQTTHCGYVAIIGRPNVGKSTLLNRLLGEKISITSHKPQTTRHQILGIKTQDNIQTIYVDTPGLHKNVKRAINRYMNRTALQTLEEVDVICWMIESLRWFDEDEWIYKRLKEVKKPIILIVNKVDQIKQKTDLLPYLQQLGEKIDFAQIIPVSAQSGSNVAELEAMIAKLLPENPFYFPEDQLTDRNDRFLAAEIIREKLMRRLHKEIPYALTVEVNEFKEKENILHIHATIWVEKENQKAIVIGDGGLNLKNVGKLARLDMEKLFDNKVFLQLWVKVKENWSDDEKALRSFGYRENK